ncbi:MAG: hypothetical protein H7308_02000 [Chthonomonadaceae bacterium]|nr:hypothetical protein [Chthonomonadaceae bacterium]
MHLRLPLLSLMFALPLTPALAQQKPAQKQNVVKFGDVTLSAYTRIEGNLNFSNTTVSGTRTLLVIPDKASGSELRLHADTIGVKSTEDSPFEATEMSGHVRYTLTQKTKEGTRILEGTAGHATFRRTTRLIELSQGVDSTLTDAERLAQPGTFRAGKITADLSKSPVLYTLSGNASETDIRFKPKESSGKAELKTEIAETHISRFREGSFQVGQTALFRGAETVADFLNPAGKSSGQIKAALVEAKFTETKSRLKSATATGNVRYRLSRLGEDGKAEESLDGTAGEVVYDYLNQMPRYVLKDNVEVTVISPKQIRGPAMFSADRVEIDQLAEVKDKPQSYRYTLTSRPGNALVSFTPLAPKPPLPGKSALAFRLGTLTIKQFEKGTLETGKSFSLSGKRVLFDSTDKESGSEAKFSSESVVGTYLEAGVIGSATASGNVEFSINQPSRKVGIKTRAAQAIKGKSSRVLYVTGKEERSITFAGPLSAQLIDTDTLEKPGVITAKSGDKLILTLTDDSYDLSMDTPSEASTVVLEPKIKSKKQDTPSPKPDVKNPTSTNPASTPPTSTKTEKGAR